MSADTEFRDVLTKADIISAVQSKTGFPRRVAAGMVQDLFEIIKQTLENGENVKISGFGNFEVKEKGPRRGRNPQSGESMTIEGRTVVTFKPSQVLRKQMNES